MVDVETKLARLASLVPNETYGRITESKIMAGDVTVGDGGKVEVHIDDAELVEFRIKELNSIASDLMDTANERGRKIAEWVAWASRLRATLNAQPSDQPYSRKMLDSVMFDCPLKVEG